MVSLMKEAQTTKPEIQKVADQISQYFVPIVLLISISSFIIWIVLVGIGVIPDSWRNDEPPLLFVTCFTFLSMPKLDFESLSPTNKINFSANMVRVIFLVKCKGFFLITRQRKYFLKVHDPPKNVYLKSMASKLNFDKD